MKSRVTSFVPVKMSLADLAGADYLSAVCEARTALTGLKISRWQKLGRESVDFFPSAMQRRLHALLPRTGQKIAGALRRTAAGATTRAFEAVTRAEQAPLSGYGYFRAGEDGRQYFILKSEHYHAPLGHAFPGYRLLNIARALGIPNATHNNTRGYLARKLEMELIRTARGVVSGQKKALNRILTDKSSPGVNCVLNLETGSLAMEAALKLVLARFYASQADQPRPRYAGRIPVLVVIGNDQNGLQANYHGTTVIAQMLRGMWAPWRERMEKQRLLIVRNVRPNAPDELQTLLNRYDRPPYKVAGFFHEIVMMNYGGRLIAPEFLRRAYAECRKRDIPTCVDEIQSCLWHPDLFMFREYGLEPDLVAIGKGFPGGEYPASRLLLNSRLDVLSQFGALVTNGQEELASLAYLITMHWAEKNAEITRAAGDYYEQRLREWAARRKGIVTGIHGGRHLLGIEFADINQSREFVRQLKCHGLDISVQTYKTDCPPVALTKLPLIAGYEVIDWLMSLMEDIFRGSGGGRHQPRGRSGRKVS